MHVGCVCRHEEAERLLMEVVRQVPNLAEPYFTLGALHDSAGNIRKALSFYMIAAHMSSKVCCPLQAG